VDAVDDDIGLALRILIIGGGRRDIVGEGRKTGKRPDTGQSEIRGLANGV
jgi:hypothetical protein